MYNTFKGWIDMSEKCEQVPWIEYLEIDEETLERKLRPNTPYKIKKAYEKYQLEVQEHIKNGTMIPK